MNAHFARCHYFVMKQFFQKCPIGPRTLWMVPVVCCIGGGVGLGVGALGAIAQPAATGQMAQRLPHPYNFLFVNPTAGNDASNGGEQTPLRTITQALAAAPPNTIIVLAPGTYSSATGETFPLQLKSGTTIQGDPRTRGQAMVIKGGGFFLSRSFARQNVTIVGANRAGLTGVTVSNPSPQGYGLWIESTNPVVVDSTFTGSDHDGVSVVGNSTAILRNNYFYQNGANGITIYGTSRPVLQDNIFEQTGFGINVNQNAAPRLINNRITQNKDGIVVQGNAQPVLRNNVIDGNDRDGLVAIAQSRPDLGTAAEPGNNTFLNNHQFDINAKVSSQTLPAFGNQLAAPQTIGKIDFSGTALSPTPVATSNLPPLLARRQANAARQVTPAIKPAAIAIPVPTPVTPVPRVSPPETSQREITFSRPSEPSGRLRQSSSAPADMPVPTVTSLPTGLPILNSIRRLPAPLTRSQADLTVPTERSMVAPEIPTPAIARLSPTPNLDVPNATNVLPVPSSMVPVGNVGDMPSVAVWRSPAQRSTTGGVTVSPNRSSSAALHYRVVVETNDETQQAQVRTLVPEAFLATAGGRSVMQAGAFSDRSKANQLLEILTSQGLRARVENL